MKLSLEVLGAGKQEGKLLEIKKDQFVVGRDPQCHLRPASPLISKRHCAILQREDKAFVQDFGSTNGTFVNDQPVKGEVELHHGDKLAIGPLLFSVRLEATPSVDQPTPPPPTKTAAKPAAAKTPAKSPGKTPAKAPAALAPPAESPPAESPPAKAPAKASKPAPAPAASQEDDDIAAMLLGGGDDSEASSFPPSEEVPEGSTVHDLRVPPLPEIEAAGKAVEKEKEKEKEKPKPANTANTASAAANILAQYMKRPR